MPHKTSPDEFYIQCVQHGGYLHGGNRHIRLGLNTSRDLNWIKWRLIPTQDGEFFIQCVKNDGFLDSRFNHIRTLIHDIDDSDWITWRLIEAGNNTYYIQCVQKDHEIYLDGGMRHYWKDSIENNLNPDFIKWKLISLTHNNNK